MVFRSFISPSDRQRIDDPLVSICVPVYNVDSYLRECLDSLASQDYPHIEVILVDDGSTDTSGAICDEYVARMPDRFKVLHKDNEGLLLARRSAYQQARGEYVMCVDSDDVLLPGAVTIVEAAFNQTGADVVRFKFTRDATGLYGENRRKRTLAYEFYSEDERSIMLHSLCCATSGSQNAMWAKAVRRSSVGADVNLSSFKGLTFAEDFLQTILIYDRARTFCLLDAQLYYYRPGSGVTRSYSPENYKDICRCMDFAEPYAARWEQELQRDDLLVGLAACRLDSAAQYAEYLASKGDRVELDELQGSEDFRRCSATAGIADYLRIDRRTVLWALRHRNYPIISFIAEIKSIKRGLSAAHPASA